MYGCYVEVVFHFVAKAILFLCFFGFDIAISLHTLSFFKMFFIILVYIYIYIYLLPRTTNIKKISTFTTKKFTSFSWGLLIHLCITGRIAPISQILVYIYPLFYVCFHQSIIVFIITKRFGSYTTTFISGIIIITKNILLFILH